MLGNQFPHRPVDIAKSEGPLITNANLNFFNLFSTDILAFLLCDFVLFLCCLCQLLLFVYYYINTGTWSPYLYGPTKSVGSIRVRVFDRFGFYDASRSADPSIQRYQLGGYILRSRLCLDFYTWQQAAGSWQLAASVSAPRVANVKPQEESGKRRKCTGRKKGEIPRSS